MSTLSILLAVGACIAAGVAGAFCMRFYIERTRIIAEREDPRDTKIRDLQATVKLARKDLSLTRSVEKEATEHIKLAHDRINELLEQRSMLREKFSSCETLLKNEIGEKELMHEKLSVANTQLETMKERNQELELQLRAADESDMLDPSAHGTASESNGNANDPLSGVFTQDVVEDDSPSLIQSLTGELDRWKHHCHVLGNELKHQRDQIGQERAPVPSDTIEGVDELTDIRGIGRALARKLHELGIYRFQELINLDADDLEHAQTLIPDIERRMKRDDWVIQAQTLYRSKYSSSGT